MTWEALLFGIKNPCNSSYMLLKVTSKRKYPRIIHKYTIFIFIYQEEYNKCTLSIIVKQFAFLKEIIRRSNHDESSPV